MIEEAHVPQCVVLLARMTRRRLRLAGDVGYPVRPLPSWRNRIADFLPAPTNETATIDQPSPLRHADTSLMPPEIECDPLGIPASWAERALAELEQQSGAVDAIEHDPMPASVTEAHEDQALDTVVPHSIADGIEVPSNVQQVTTVDAQNGAIPTEGEPSQAQWALCEGNDDQRLLGQYPARVELPRSLVTLRQEVAAPAVQTALKLISELPSVVAGQEELFPTFDQSAGETVRVTNVPAEDLDSSPVLTFGGNAEQQTSVTSNVAPLNSAEQQPASIEDDRSVIVPVFIVHPPVVETAASESVPAELSDHNRIGLNYRRPMPRPKVNGFVVDFHCRLLAARHSPAWFEAADHYGIDCFVTMTPLEEAAALKSEWGGRLQFMAVPLSGEAAAALSPAQWVEDFLVRIEAFYDLGSRVVKFDAAPGTLPEHGMRLDSPLYKPLFREIVARKMGVMTHIGDPPRSANGDEHYPMWEGLLAEYPGIPWIGTHLGGNPEDPARLQRLLDRFPDLWLDSSATPYLARQVNQRRDAVREFHVRNRDRLLFGTDQVSSDDRGFDVLASRFWTHRKLWETAYAGPSPIADANLPPGEHPMLRGLALPDQVLQRMYHDNAVQFLAKVGVGFGGWG